MVIIPKSLKSYLRNSVSDNASFGTRVGHRVGDPSQVLRSRSGLGASQVVQESADVPSPRRRKEARQELGIRASLSYISVLGKARFTNQMCQ